MEYEKIEDELNILRSQIRDNTTDTNSHKARDLLAASDIFLKEYNINITNEMEVFRDIDTNSQFM